MELNTSTDFILQSEYLRESNILNLLPSAVYVCDASGEIVNYNHKAIELWGRTPGKGDARERFCASYRLYLPDGTRLARDETPVAHCLLDGRPRKDQKLIIERTDGSRITVNANVVPIRDEQGRLVGVLNTFTDITDQLKTEHELGKKQRELQDYVENASVALHWVDENGIIKWANEAELKMLGYTADEYIGQHISRFHVNKNKIDDILTRLSCNEKLDQYETEVRCKDGTIKTVRISSSVYRDEGRFIHTRCFTIDVTAQKKLFAALSQSEAQYRELVESLDVPIYTTDAAGIITLYNQAAAHLWGRRPIIGQDMWCGSFRILKSDGTDMPLDQCPMAVCLKERRPVYGEEIIVIRPDGSKRNVSPRPRPLFDENGQIAGAVNMLIDITETKQIENRLREREKELSRLTTVLEKKVEEKTADLQKKNEALKRSEERYHKMIEDVEDYAIILLDKNGIVQNWNKGAEKIKGYREEEIIGKSFSEFYLPEDRANGLPQKMLSTASLNGKAVYEGWRMRKDGSLFWGSIVLTALHDDQNELIGFSKVTRDLTKRKMAEDRLKEYASQLEFQNRELAQFAFAASHDLKEPLRKIHFYNSAILHENIGRFDDKSMSYINRSMNAAKRMMDLIEDLLNYSRTTSNLDSFESVDLNEVLDCIVQMRREDFEEGPIALIRDRLPVVTGIPFQLKQLLDNLIGNAIKYKHPERPLRIEVRTSVVKGFPSPNEILDRHKKYYRISILDNGIGFESEYAEKIFNIFQRLNNHPTARGSGMGLAICKRIVQNHHGQIFAESKLNEWSRFDIYLPVDPEL